MTSTADSQLLFGLLALQNGLIDPSKLIAAFQAWMLDRSKSLADHLVTLGFLDDTQKTVVESLTKLHIQAHGGDITQSLESIPIAESTRRQLTDLGEADLDATLTHIGASASTPFGPPRDDNGHENGHDGPGSSEGRRFRVVRPHAKGGLGAVFVAVDSELNREVALKQILDQHADNPDSRQRFVVEAEITGGLEHPGIVPVYGLGTYGDGRPYYAMRFIRGESLKEAIDAYHKGSKGRGAAGVLAFRQLLKKFTDVCNAIEYAHSRGVLHRDIKPANVIVGNHGETLVVDWGLAKALGRGSADAEHTLIPSSADSSSETLPGQVMGTPAYMGPEQARGDLEGLGPRSDVYSLGATLYYLLVGKSPFEGPPIAVLKAVQAGDYRHPRAVDPSIDAALEAIALKAMANKPDDRYASARALAEDIDRWLADERISAYREPWTRSLNRWLTRHRTAVTGAAAAGIMLMAGLAVVAAVQTQAKRKVDYANGRLKSANSELTESNAALEVQRNRAEERESQAIDAVKRFRDAVADNPELKDNPGLESLRKALLKEPLSFFGKLRERLQADRDTRPESLARLAGVIHDYAYLTNEIGGKGDALKAYEDSLAIWESLNRGDPDNAAYRERLAIDLHGIGLLLHATGRTAEALETFERARDLFARLAEEHPDVTFYRARVADNLHGIGVRMLAMGRTAEALQALDQARDIFARLAEEHPDVTDYRARLAAILHDIGAIPSATGRKAEALKAFDQARDLFARLAEEHPDVIDYRARLAAVLNNIGKMLAATGRTAEAMEAHERARDILARLSDVNPAVTAYRVDLARSLQGIGDLLSATGRPTKALEAHERARDIRAHLAEEHPDVTEYRSDLAGSLSNIGGLLHDTSRPIEALEAHERARDIRAHLAEEHPDVTEYRSDLADSLNNIGVMLRASGHTAEALGAYERARDLFAQLAEEHPDVAHYRARLATSLYNLGNLLRDTGHSADALKSFERARDLFARLAEEHPDVTRYRAQLAASLTNIGVRLRAFGRPADALEAYEQARAISIRLAKEHPESPEYASGLGYTLHNIAVIERSQSRWAEARQRLIEAAAWQSKALAANPRHPLYRQGFEDHLTGRIQVAQELHLEDEAAVIASELAEFLLSDPKFAPLDTRLEAIRNGDSPKDNPERLALAQRTYDIHRYREAAQLWGEALESDPKLADDRQSQHPYNAACAAALAADGQGIDLPADEARAKLREKALGWLRSEREALSILLDSGHPQAKAVVAQTLQHWKEDTDLESIRDRIEKLPEVERADWQALWADVDALLKRASGD